MQFFQLIQNLGISENLLNDCFQTEFVDTDCVMPEPSVKLLLIATHPNLAMFEACAVITASMK